jgi:hypothetical protein
MATTRVTLFIEDEAAGIRYQCYQCGRVLEAAVSDVPMHVRVIAAGAMAAIGDLIIDIPGVITCDRCRPPWWEHPKEGSEGNDGK